MYREHLNRVRKEMEANQIDLMFLGFGREFSYISGTLTPPVYTDLRVWGDWIAGILFSLDRDPVLVLHDDHGDRLNLSPLNHWGQYYVRCEDELLVGKETGELLTPFTYEPVIIEG